MTVVSTLKLDKKSGVAASDEREIHFGGRGYDIAQKISQLASRALVGYSGFVPFGESVINQAKELISSLKDDTDFTQVVQSIEAAYQKTRAKFFEEGLLSKYNLTLEDYRQGKLAEPLLEHILRAAENQKDFTCAF
jgi:hypothetical protein